jgi:23S rRNA (uracil1939-C5)-methyltransferase
MKLRIEKAIYGGAGLAHIPLEEIEGGGKTVFVPGTLPGELVEARLTDDRRSFANAELVSVIEPSPLRIIPDCEYVPRCGGCQYQHASYELQLQMKLDILKETLSRAHLPVSVTFGVLSGTAWGYRNRVRLHWGKQQQGLELAYRERASHHLLPVTHCPIAAPLLEQAMTTVTRVGAATGIDRICQEVEFFTNSDQTQLLISLWPATEKAPQKRNHKTPPGRREQILEMFAEALKQKLPSLTGVGLLAENEIMHWGQRSLAYTVGEHSFQVSLGSFFQVNRFLVPDLLGLVTDEGRRSGRLAWDLYAGVGLFARALRFESVVAVESAGYSADDLKHNLARTQRMTRSNTLDFLRNQTRAPLRVKPDLIVADPPRAGMGKDVCTLLGKIGAPTLICISCDPATLARDLQSLLPFGYAIDSIHLVDLFPQTFHLETVVILKRN